MYSHRQPTNGIFKPLVTRPARLWGRHRLGRPIDRAAAVGSGRVGSADAGTLRPHLARSGWPDGLQHHQSHRLYGAEHSGIVSQRHRLDAREDSLGMKWTKHWRNTLCLEALVSMRPRECPSHPRDDIGMKFGPDSMRNRRRSCPGVELLR